MLRFDSLMVKKIALAQKSVWMIGTASGATSIQTLYGMYQTFVSPSLGSK